MKMLMGLMYNITIHYPIVYSDECVREWTVENITFNLYEFPCIYVPLKY
jgi:hypothetical protein